MRKCVGRGIWIQDYKKALKDDAVAGVNSDSEDNSRELLKKELMFIDNLKGKPKRAQTLRD